jgi:hypothetical protein
MDQILIFDIDGVLIKSGGYRAAFRETLKLITEQMGLSHVELPGDDHVNILESLGITSEWDMLPITLAIWFEHLFTSHPPQTEIESLDSALAWAKKHTWIGTQPNLIEEYKKVGIFHRDGVPVSESIFQTCSGNPDGGPFPNLAQHGFMADLFLNTRRMDRNRISRTLQNFIVGGEIFRKVYPSLPFFETPAFLKEFDQVLLDQESLIQIQRGRQNRLFKAVSMTARPCHIELEKQSYTAGYSPETEIALEACGLVDLPYIGYGNLVYTAERLGILPDRLLKPSAFQALAAIAAAWWGDTNFALTWAYEIFRKSNTDLSVKSRPCADILIKNDFPKKFRLDIFEDSPVGIQAGLNAVNILRSYGYQIELQGWGIATHVDKVKALQSVGARVFDDINPAVRSLQEDKVQ